MKQVDFDGKFTYSKIIIAECIFTSEISIDLYPNPAKNEIILSVSEEIIGSEYIISNNCGKSILSGSIDNQLSKINIQELTPGVYLLNIITQFGNIYNEKTVKN